LKGKGGIEVGIFRFYTTLLRKLAKSPKDAVGKSLDELAGVCGDFPQIAHDIGFSQYSCKRAGTQGWRIICLGGRTLLVNLIFPNLLTS
jgi:hypothetical protein